MLNTLWWKWKFLPFCLFRAIGGIESPDHATTKSADNLSFANWLVFLPHDPIRA